MDNQTTEFVAHQVQEFAQAVNSDSWKLEHQDAIRCRNLENWLDIGLGLYDAIRQLDARWAAGVRANKTSFDRQDAEAIGRLYEWWLRPCERLTQEIRDLETKGYVVERAAEFREAIVYVRGAMSISLDRVLQTKELPSKKRHSVAELRDALSQTGRIRCVA